MTGAAWVGWDGNYSFNADGRRIPVESLKLVEFPKAPLSGLAAVLRVRRRDLRGTAVRRQVPHRRPVRRRRRHRPADRAARPPWRGVDAQLRRGILTTRGVGSGARRLDATQKDVEMTLRFTETSLDPYVRFFEPRLSPFTNAVAGGTVRVSGELADMTTSSSMPASSSST